MLHVRVGGVDFHGHATSGFLIGPGGFRGWEGAAATKRSVSERTGAHGSFDAASFKSARLVTLAGHALASSEGELEHLEDVLAGVGQSRQQITVTTGKGTRWAYGSVEGPVVWERIGGASEAEFEVSFLLPDPFKYGETRESVSTGANVSAFHRGNTEAWPRFRVSAPFADGYRLRGPNGESFSVTGTMSGSSVDLVDFRTGMVSRNGVPLRRAVLSPETWPVPGGALVEWRVEPIGTGGGSASMFLTDTFV